MSAPKRRLILAPRAQGDVRDIEAYTRARWDAAQWEDYRASLDRAFDALIENPELGRARPELGAQIRSHVMREHIIYYQVGAGTLLVLRIRHGRTDPRRALRG